MKTWNKWPIVEIEIKNPPKKVFVRGNLNYSLLEKSIAVVGTRRMTNYGKDVVERLVFDLVRAGVTIISGFMYGVDTQAHKVAIEAQGKTIAVFGCGLDVCYPPENDSLYTQILEGGGAVVSEYEASSKPHLWKFPQRNRIVAGLSSLGVLVIEAGEASGSLITAEIARKQGKKVFAVPGHINSSESFGTNRLIRDGKAKMVLDVHDILGGEEKREEDFASFNLSPLEKEIFDLLMAEPQMIDDLAKKLKKDVVEVSSMLTMMSLKGLIYESAGNYYLKNQS